MRKELTLLSASRPGRYDRQMSDHVPGAAESPLADLEIGTVLDERYRIDQLIGRGGMASVYRATDEMLGRTVAVKLFSTQLGSSRDLRREISEIRTLASLNHHALVTLFDAHVADVPATIHPYLVMEYVEGPTLGQRIKQGPLASAEVEKIAVDLAEGLHVVHALGIVHRDIKPENVLLSISGTPDRQYRAKLADFGIAMLTDATRLTHAGSVLGTAAYLSPEQVRGEPVASASDIYSLGLVLSEALTGQRAFGGTLAETVAAKLSGPPTIPGELGNQWRSLLTAMTADQPDARPDAWGVAETVRSFRPAGERADEVTGATAEIAATEAYSLTRVLPLADSPASAPTAQTVVIAPAEPGQDPHASADGTPGRRRGPRLLLMLALIGTAVAIIAGIVLAISQSPRAAAPPAASTMPSVDGRLAEHLQQLMESVSP